VMSLWGDVPPRETYPRAKAAALRALELDSSLAEPHATLGDVHAMFEWNWPAAEREFQRAVARDSNSANTWHWYGGDYLSPVGRAEEAIAAGRRARELDPLSPTINAGAGITLYRAGRYREALDLLHGVRSLDPGFVLVNSGLGEVHLIQGRYQEAVAALERAVDPAVRHSMDLALLGTAYARAGRRPDAVRLLRELEERGAGGYVSRTSLALLHAGVGDSAKAFQMLARAVELRDPFLVYYFASDPLAAELRRDRRGVRLLQQMGLGRAP
jgi:tetratricopeptide (TPR) repeat protein